MYILELEAWNLAGDLHSSYFLKISIFGGAFPSAILNLACGTLGQATGSRSCWLGEWRPRRRRPAPGTRSPGRSRTRPASPQAPAPRHVLHLQVAQDVVRAEESQAKLCLGCV